ncbi:MAG: response regulator transcription factor [Candidatus Competibacter sp.]|nr:response regulator transcription factor [Candidatus Competibacter sp.]
MLERWPSAMGQEQGTIIVLLRPFHPRTQLIRRLQHYGLSPSQCRVATHVLNGLSNGDIAHRQLHLSEQTVKDHLQEVYWKVGVRSRAALIAKILGTGSAIASERSNRRRQ